jgi:hypothetical protein
MDEKLYELVKEIAHSKESINDLVQYCIDNAVLWPKLEICKQYLRDKVYSLLDIEDFQNDDTMYEINNAIIVYYWDLYNLSSDEVKKLDPFVSRAARNAKEVFLNLEDCYFEFKWDESKKKRSKKADWQKFIMPIS